jgi:eukaryotic-like serine/threonine-protein kinase
LNASNRERVKELLVQASRLEPERRKAFIESAAGGSAEIAAEAIELLHTLDDSGFMSAPTGAGFAGTQRPAGLPGEGPGTKIGRYKLLQLVGEGGFGSVFMAEQTEPVHRRVALKIIKAGMDTKQVIARFEAERQALAMMDHPNIARVLDAGATDAGRPYFVMELVRGEPVMAYCDEHRMPVRERLELFINVCHAVQHAHQKGIIHRDLKPSNVLVTVADGKPMPKVIDFGIAKATGARLTDKTLFTEMHQLIGTPEYMSPEQAEVSGVDIDTRSDIYSLGVLLYELLAGTTPLERGRLRSTPLAEIQRLIREEEPPRPSYRFATMASTPAAATPLKVNDSSALDIAQRRQSEPGVLTRTLRGDLDWIVMKCLEKDRSRRYASASALTDDIERYLEDQPVTATPPTRAYQLRKFARRNKTMIGGVAALTIALLLGTVGSTIGFVKATQAKKLALQKSEESSLAAAKAAAVSNFLQEMLASVDPSKSLGKEVTIKQALDEAAAKVDTGILKDQPAIEADLRGTIGTTYTALGHYPEAEKHLRTALSIRRKIPDDRSALAQDLVNLSDLLSAQGNRPEEEQCIREALGLFQQIYAGDRRESAGAEQALAASLRAQGKLAEAEPHYRAALEMRKRLFGAEHGDVAQSLNSLALLAQNKGDLVTSEQLFREALAIRIKVFGQPHPIVADALNNLGNLYYAQKRYQDAEPLLREALAMRRQLFSADHPAIAQSINALANVLWADKHDAMLVEPLRREALAIWRKSLPANHPHIAYALDALGIVLIVQKSYADAEILLKEALAIYESASPRDDHRFLRATSLLGEALAGQGRYDEAEVFLLKTIDGLKEHPEPLLAQETGRRLIQLYEMWNRPDDAAKWQAELSR